MNRTPAQASRVHRTPAIAVSWEPGLCVHVAECVRALPGGVPDHRCPQRAGRVCGRVALRRPAGGEVVRTANRAALCRCGRSDNMPFCSGAHRGATFDDSPPGTPAGPVTGEPRTGPPAGPQER